MKKLTYAEFEKAMFKFNTDNGFTSKGNSKSLNGVIVFTPDSFSRPFTEEERSYRVSSDNKAFFSGMCSNSIFGDCLDGKDLGVRLDWYMYDGWKVDYCYLLESEEN